MIRIRRMPRNRVYAKKEEKNDKIMTRRRRKTRRKRMSIRIIRERGEC
jgi:hypothetical protein